MEPKEAIRARHSVRKYLDKPVEAGKVAILQEAVKRCNEEAGLNIQLVLDEPNAFTGLFISTYGQFSCVKNYLVMAAPKGREWEEKIGWHGEELVILAQSLGLNTCWVGLTFKKVAGAFTLREGDTVHCVIALGYGENQGRQHPLKPLEKFYEAEVDVPAWFKEGMEAAVLAPTAVNQQKFKFVLHPGNVVEARGLFSFAGYVNVDLGIVKHDFALAAGPENFTWK
ncbi:MAG: nitroreductase [Bacteroidales bacterium]|nr:nitroreductase [Bacteroidales bacterium]